MEGTTFGWVIQLQGGDDRVTDHCMLVREVNDYERSYSLDVLGVKDRGENDQLDVLKEFKDDVNEAGRWKISSKRTMDPWQRSNKHKTSKQAEGDLKTSIRS